MQGFKFDLMLYHDYFLLSIQVRTIASKCDILLNTNIKIV